MVVRDAIVSRYVKQLFNTVVCNTRVEEVSMATATPVRDEEKRDHP